MAACIGLVVGAVGCGTNQTPQKAQLRRPAGAIVLPVLPDDFSSRVFASSAALDVVRIFSVRRETKRINDGDKTFFFPGNEFGTAIPGPIRYFALDIPVGDYPTYMKLFPGSLMMAVLNEGSRDISLIDARINLEGDWYVSQAATAFVNGEAREYGVSRLMFADDPFSTTLGDRARIQEIAVGPELDIAGALAAYGAAATDDPTPYHFARLYASLPETGEIGIVRVALSPPPGKDRVWQIRRLPLGKPNGLAAFPGTIALGRSSTVLYAADIAQPRLLAIDIEAATVRASDTTSLKGSLEAVSVLPAFKPDLVAASATAPRPLVDNPEAIYGLDFEAGTVSIFDPATLTALRPSPSFRNRDKPGLVFRNKQPVDIAFSDTPLVYGNCIGQVAMVPFASGEFYMVDVGGCLPVVETEGTQLGVSVEDLTDETKSNNLVNEQLIMQYWTTGVELGPRRRPHSIFDGQQKGPSIQTPTYLAPPASSLATGQTTTEPQPTIVDANGVLPPLADGTIQEGIGRTDGVLINEGYGVFVNDGCTESELWTLTWQGLLPLTGDAIEVASFGAIEGDGTQFADAAGKGIDFYLAGVNAGDVLELTPAFQPQGVDPALCPASVVITAVSPTALTLPGPLDPTCYPSPLVYSVRAQGAYTVVGSRTGYSGRAYEDGTARYYPEGTDSTNFFVQFALASATGITRVQGEGLTFRTNSGRLPASGDATIADAADASQSINLLPSSVNGFRMGGEEDGFRFMMTFPGSNSTLLLNPYEFARSVDSSNTTLPLATVNVLRSATLR